jgi:hypothetical protein
MARFRQEMRERYDEEGHPFYTGSLLFHINYGIDVSLGVALPLESKAYEVTIPTRDRQDALAAFAEKCRPVFRGE